MGWVSDEVNCDDQLLLCRVESRDGTAELARSVDLHIGETQLLSSNTTLAAMAASVSSIITVSTLLEFIYSCSICTGKPRWEVYTSWCYEEGCAQSCDR